MKRVITKIGDIFQVKVDDTKRYFQYVVNDMTQLNSDVIGVFKKKYPIESNPNISEIVEDKIEFYAHCVIKLGIQGGYWEKIGKIANIEKIDALFRDCNDNPKTPISNDWWVWEVNGPERYVGKLEGENRKAELGIVVAPHNIVERLRTGKYQFIYPGFE